MFDNTNNSKKMSKSKKNRIEFGFWRAKKTNKLQFIGLMTYKSTQVNDNSMVTVYTYARPNGNFKYVYNLIWFF